MQGVGSDDIVGLEGSIPLEGHGRGIGIEDEGGAWPTGAKLSMTTRGSLLNIIEHITHTHIMCTWHTCMQMLLVSAKCTN